MTIILELSQAEEEKLRRDAARRGVDIKAYLLSVAAERAMIVPEPMDVEKLNALLDKIGKPGPILPDDALTSEGVYQDHD
jgi:hypothetical protein